MRISDWSSDVCSSDLWVSCPPPQVQTTFTRIRNPCRRTETHPLPNPPLEGEGFKSPRNRRHEDHHAKRRPAQPRLEQQPALERRHPQLLRRRRGDRRSVGKGKSG